MCGGLGGGGGGGVSCIAKVLLCGCILGQRD